jgi:hypothetical protein
VLKVLTVQRRLMLRVGLQFDQDGSWIKLDLTRPDEAAETASRVWRLPLSTLRLPSSLEETIPDLELPLQVLDGVRDSIAALDARSTQPLWLELVRPYGFVGVLSWERVLAKALGRPVLRLPSSPERPLENIEVLEAAVLFVPFTEMPLDRAKAQLLGVCHAIFAGSTRLQKRVHVFTTGEWYARLTPLRFDHPEIELHEPPEATDKSLSGVSQSATNPTRSATRTAAWEEFVSTKLAGRSLDAVYFICPSESTDSGCALLVPRAPSGRGAKVFAPMDVAELKLVLTRLGAWAALFSPPADEIGAPQALVADALAQERPGIVLFCRTSTPAQWSALQAACGLVFSKGRGAAPQLADGFIYCHPGMVAGEKESPAEVVAPLVSRLVDQIPLGELLKAKASRLIPLLDKYEIKQAPDWVAAAQRYLESAALDQLRRRAPDVLLSQPHRDAGGETNIARKDSVQQALADVQNALQSYLDNPRKA